MNLESLGAILIPFALVLLGVVVIVRGRIRRKQNWMTASPSASTPLQNVARILILGGLIPIALGAFFLVVTGKPWIDTATEFVPAIGLVMLVIGALLSLFIRQR